MDHIVNSMEHIEIDTACRWLDRLIEPPFPVSSKILMELCEQYSTPVYIDCSALEGVIAPRVGSRFVVQEVIGSTKQTKPRESQDSRGFFFVVPEDGRGPGKHLLPVSWATVFRWRRRIAHCRQSEEHSPVSCCIDAPAERRQEVQAATQA